MKIGLIDVDSHNWPNLCLMKLSAYHKARGDLVEWWNPGNHYDLVYKSRVFTDTYSKDTIAVTPTVTVEVKMSDSAKGRVADLLVTVTGAQNGAAPAGSITLTSDGLNETLTLQNGKTTHKWENLSDKEYTVTAAYSGDTNYKAANSKLTFDAAKKNQESFPGHKVKKPSVPEVRSFRAKPGKKKLVFSWKKVPGAAGFQIQISTKKGFKGAKTISVSKSNKTYTKKGLKTKKKYYIRIRAYKTYLDKNKKTKRVYGKWIRISKKTR